MKTDTHYKILLAVVVLVWGVHWPVMKIGLSYITPLWFCVTRLLLGSLVMMALVGARGELRLPSRRDVPVLLSVGVLQMGAYLALVIMGLRYVGAGRSSILAYTTPIWVTPLAIGLLGETMSLRKATGLIVAMAGIAVMVGPWAVDWGDRNVLLANGALLLSAVLWAGGIIHVRLHRWHGSALQLAPWQMLLGGLLVLPLALTLEGDATIQWGPSLALVLAYTTLLATAFCFSAWVVINRRLPALTLSLAALATPVVGLVSSMLVTGERLSVVNTAGLVAISLGLLVVFSERAEQAA